jgi:two-component system NtrC family response regulator
MPDEKRKLLIVEDDRGLQKQLKWALSGYEVIAAENRQQAIAELRRHEPPVVLQDLGLPPDAAGVEEGFATLREILSFAPRTKVIVVTGNGDRDNAVRAVGAGAYDFYSKPVDVDVLNLLIDRAWALHGLEEAYRQLQAAGGMSPFEGIIASGSAMQRVCRTIEKIAPVDVTTLLLGESGTGKEVFARAIHALSPRRDKRFVAINCAAIPENLLESELFGYEKGAFTGANKTTPGKIELASGGTLLLDEIGDMPPSLQSKLLRFLQERVVERVGGRDEIPVDVRVICATNQDLTALMADGRFRQDLYYRVSEVTVTIPPLREREGGQLVLARLFLDRYSEQMKRKLKGFTDGATAAIRGYAWPGNVREMENKIKGAVVVADGPLLTAGDLGLAEPGSVDAKLNLRQVRDAAERHALEEALALAAGNISRAAELLGVARPTVYDLLQRHGLGGGPVRPETD